MWVVCSERHLCTQNLQSWVQSCIFELSVCIFSCLLSVTTGSHTSKQQKFPPKVLVFIQICWHFCFQKLMETSGNAKFSCCFGYQPFPVKSANIPLPFPLLPSTVLHNFDPVVWSVLSLMSGLFSCLHLSGLVSSIYFFQRIVFVLINVCWMS